MQAVIQIGTSQYLVSPDQTLLASKSKIDRVLLLIDGAKTVIGQPDVESVQIKLTDLGPVLGDKIRVSKFKAKSRYHKTIGFRPRFHKIKIDTIDIREKKV